MVVDVEEMEEWPAHKDVELPQGWAWTTLGEIAHINGRDASLKSLPDKLPVSFVPMAAVDAMTGAITEPQERQLTEVRKGFTPFQDGDVLFAKITPCMENGKAAIAKNLQNGRGFGSTEFHVLQAGKHVTPEWIFYFVRQLTFRQEAKANFAGTAGQLRVPTKFLENHEIPLPPLPEQHRIVAKIEELFSELDAGVANLKRVQAALKRYRASVLKAACEGKLVPQDPNDEPASQLLERILSERRAKWEEEQRAKGKDPAKVKYEEPAPPDMEGLPELPEGWVWARAEQLCDFITKGTTPAPDKLHSGVGDVPYIKVYNLTNTGQLDFTIKPTFIGTMTHAKELARSRVYPGDVLMNIVGPPLGKVSIVPNTFPQWNINQAVAIFRPMSNYSRNFLALSLLTEDILAWAVRRAKATAGQFNLTLEICRNLPLPVPPVSEQARIVAETERRLSVAQALEDTIEVNLKRAERLRQAILKRAFEGRLVEQDQANAPASNSTEAAHGPMSDGGIQEEAQQKAMLQEVKQMRLVGM